MFIKFEVLRQALELSLYDFRVNLLPSLVSSAPPWRTMVGISVMVQMELKLSKPGMTH